MADISVTRKRKRRESQVPPVPEIAPQELFYPLIVQIVKGESDVDSEVGVDPDPDGAAPMILDAAEPTHPDQTVEEPLAPATSYDRAVARIEALQSHLTESMALDLTSLLSVIHSYLSSPTGTDHPLITQIADPLTSATEIATLAKTVGCGLSAFLARGGNGPRKPPPAATDQPPAEDLNKPKTSSSSTRSRLVPARCAERDDRTCCITGQRAEGLVAHVIPFSVRDTTALNFWKFIAMFRGEAATTLLRTSALGAGNTTDTLRNVWWLCGAAHTAFDSGRMTIIPELEPEQIPYDAGVIAEYRARVEFPAGLGEVSLPIVTYRRRGGRAQLAGLVRPGASITFRTPDPVRLPLPHPLLFQLHAICSRVLAMKAAAGWQPDRFYGEDDDDGSEDVDVGSVAEEAADEDPLDWPRVRGARSIRSHMSSVQQGIQMGISRLSCVDSADGAPDEEEEEEMHAEVEQRDKPRWPSVVRSEYAARMEEMWGKCGERLGRELKGGRWWAC